MEVHRAPGPDLLESAYQACLCRELQLRNLDFVQQIDLSLTYKGVKLDGGYRVNLLVRDRIVIELGSVQEVLPVHEAQLLTYMPLTGKSVGLLINFNVAILKKGIKCRVLRSVVSVPGCRCGGKAL